MEGRKGSYNHLDIDKRKYIERYLDEGKTFARIARDLEISPSSIYREVKRNRRCEWASHSKGADRNDCGHLKSCRLKGVCGLVTFHGECDTKLCRRCSMVKCRDYCNEYERRICPTTERAPLVCNACERFGRCTLERFRYCAETAQVSAERRNSDARRGFDLTPEDVEYLVDVVRTGLRLGRSIHHIFVANEMPCSERTFYRLVEGELIPILPIELAKKVKYKKRRGKKTDGVHPRGFYKGHEYKDFLELPLSERLCATEVDTVWGRKKDRKTILSLHRIDLHFQPYRLLQARTTEEVVAALDRIETAMEGRFSEFFGLMLLDRGAEFDDIEGMERSVTGEGRRCRVYFTDPSRPDQKGSCEKNHVELRKVLPKGTCFEGLDAATLATICSHVNSTIRKGCGDATPMQLAMLCFPKCFFDNLGLTLISPNEVIAAPGILYDPDK